MPPAPLPVPGGPKSFRAGPGLSRTRATRCSPLREIAAKTRGSLKTSGRLRTETWERTPAPSGHTIPAPSPPRGKATISRFCPEYAPLYGRLGWRLCAGEVLVVSGRSLWPVSLSAPAIALRLPTVPTVTADILRNFRRGMNESLLHFVLIGFFLPGLQLRAVCPGVRPVDRGPESGPAAAGARPADKSFRSTPRPQ